MHALYVVYYDGYGSAITGAAAADELGQCCLLRFSLVLRPSKTLFHSFWTEPFKDTIRMPKIISHSQAELGFVTCSPSGAESAWLQRLLSLASFSLLHSSKRRRQYTKLEFRAYIQRRETVIRRHSLKPLADTVVAYKC